jgi:putative membrane protein
MHIGQKGVKKLGLLLIVLALLFSLLIAILAAANHQLVIVNYIFGEAKLPLIVLIIGAAAAGAVVTGLIGFYRSIRTALQIRGEKKRQEELQRRLEKLEQEKASLQQELEHLQAPAEPEELAEAVESPEAAELPEAAETPEQAEPEEPPELEGGETS